MDAYLENLCGKMMDARKRGGIPKSELAGTTSLQAAVEAILLVQALS